MTRFYVTVLFVLFLLSGCKTSEQATQSNQRVSEPVALDAPVWYSHDSYGVINEESVISFGSAAASTESIATEAAVEQAKINMLLVIDEFLETGKNELIESGYTNAGSPSFAMVLRNAAQNFPMDGVSPDTETFEEDGVISVYARYQLNKVELMSRLERAFAGETASWNRMREVLN
jgi:hypothetical protein